MFSFFGCVRFYARTTLIRGAATRRKVPTSGGGIEVNPKSKDKNRQKVSQKILLALPFLFNSKDNGSADSHTPGKSAQRHLLIESEWMLGWFSRGRAYLLERCVRRTRTDRRSQNRADLLDGVRKERKKSQPPRVPNFITNISEGPIILLRASHELGQ